MGSFGGSANLPLLTFLLAATTLMVTVTALRPTPLSKKLIFDTLLREKVFYVVGSTSQREPPIRTKLVAFTPNQRKNFYDISTTIYDRNGCRTTRDIYRRKEGEDSLVQVSCDAGSPGVPQNVISLLGGNTVDGLLVRDQLFVDGKEVSGKTVVSLLSSDPFRTSDLLRAKDGSGFAGTLRPIPAVAAHRYECESGGRTEPYCLIDRLNTVDLSGIKKLVNTNGLYYVVARNAIPVPNLLTATLSIEASRSSPVEYHVNTTYYTADNCTIIHMVLSYNPLENRLEMSPTVNNGHTYNVNLYLLDSNDKSSVVYFQAFVDGKEDFGKSAFVALSDKPRGNVDLGYAEGIFSKMCDATVDDKYLFQDLSVRPSLVGQC